MLVASGDDLLHVSLAIFWNSLHAGHIYSLVPEPFGSKCQVTFTDAVMPDPYDLHFSRVILKLFPGADPIFIMYFFCMVVGYNSIL